jgi:hypothetical protein
VKLPQGSVSNTGQIIADAGEICLQARTVNQDGIVQANSVRTQNGVIELVTDDSLNLGATSSIRAAGDGSNDSLGGTITLRSGHTFSDQTGSQIDASGSPGGAVEISAPSILSLETSSRAGLFLLDPTDIVLGTTGTGKVGAGGGVVSTDPPSTLKLNVLTAFRNWQVNDILLEATHDITLSTGTSWDLSATTGVYYLDSDICFFNSLPVIPPNYKVALSPHMIHPRDEALYGKYNAGFLWVRDLEAVDAWRKACGSSRFFEQAALEVFDSEKWSSTRYLFPIQENYGWWRMYQGTQSPQALQSEWSIFRRDHTSGLCVSGKPLLSIHTHFGERTDIVTCAFNDYVFQYLCRLGKYPPAAALVKFLTREFQHLKSSKN